MPELQTPPPHVVREKVKEYELALAGVLRWMHPAVLVLSTVGIMFACIFLLTLFVIIPVNRFVPGVGAIDAPDAVVFLELVFLFLASTGITGLFLRWIGRQTGTIRQHVQVLAVLLALITLEIGLFTCFGVFVHDAIKDLTIDTPALSTKGATSEAR